MDAHNDGISVVTDTTRDSDETQQDLSIMLNGIYGCKEKSSEMEVHRALTPNFENVVAEDDQDSPMYPIQKSFQIQLNPNSRRSEGESCTKSTTEKTVLDRANSDSLSDLSQPLIPLVKPGTRKSKRKACPSRKKADIEEASQSLLPQTFSERSQLYANRSHMFSLPSSLKHPSTSALTDYSIHPKATQSTDLSKGDNLIPSSQRESTQSTDSSKGDKWMQNSQTGMNDQSQRSSNATDKICIRLEKLLSSLSCATSKQKRVMEITVHQCVRKLQDNILHRLKKDKIDKNHQASVKKLLQTIQSCLTKLYQHYKAERTMVHQGTMLQDKHLSQLDTSHIIQATLSELQQRQQELHTMLKQQKKLVEKLKASVRAYTESRPYLNNNDNTTAVAIITDKDKTVSSPYRPMNSQLCDSQVDTFQFSQLSNLYPHNELTQQSQLSVSDLFSSTQNENQLPEVMNANKILEEQTKEGACENNEKATSSNENNNQVSEDNEKKSKTTYKYLDENEEQPPKINEKRSESNKCSNEIEHQLSEVHGNKSKTTECLEKNAEKLLETTISQEIDTVPDTQDPDSIHVSPCSPIDLVSDTQEDLPEGNEKVLSYENEKSKESTKVSSLVGSGMQTAFHSQPISQPIDVLIPAKGTAGNRKGIEKGDNFLSPEQSNSENFLPSKNDNGGVPSKRDNSLSPNHGTSKKLKSNLSDKNIKKIEEPSSYSETLWLNMLHTNKENGKSDSGKQKNIDNNSKAIATHTETPSVFEKQVTNTQRTGMVGLLNQKSDKEQNIVRSKKDAHGLNIDDNFNINIKARQKPSSAFQENDVASNSSTTEAQFRLPSFLSPPRHHMEADMADNVSPTATSMSSDVFLVKAKELNRRMKMREKLAGKTAHIVPNTEKQVEKTAPTTISNETKLGEKSSTTTFVGSQFNQAPTIAQHTVRTRDTISEAIESVVAKSRDATADQMFDNIYTGSARLQAPFYQTPYNQANEIGQRMENREQGKSKGGNLPSMISLLNSKTILPGKNALSVFVKGLLHQATITPAGKLKTREGMLFNTPMQWLSTLTDGEPKKKRQTYKQVVYKGRPLIEVCRPEGVGPENKTTANVSTTQPTTQNLRIILNPVHNSTVKITKVTFDKAVQVESEESASKISKKISTVPRTEEEVKLNHQLTQSVIRLLTDKDFVTCEDLPSNFWTEDYVNVRLNKAMWDVVDKW